MERLDSSSFEPAFVEARFGMDEPAARISREQSSLSLPPLILEVPDSEGRPWRLEIRGIIDRIDTRKAGKVTEAVVIDYKQSLPVDTLKREISKGISLQLGIYMLALRDLTEIRPVGALYYSVAQKPIGPRDRVPEINRYGFRMKGIVAEGTGIAIDSSGAFLLGTKAKSMEELEEIMEETERHILRYASALAEGRIAPHPLEQSEGSACEGCEYADLCRFDPLIHPVRWIEKEQKDRAEGEANDTA